MIITLVRTIEYTIDESVFKKVHHLKRDESIDFEKFLEIVDEDTFSFYDSGGLKYNDEITSMLFDFNFDTKQLLINNKYRKKKER